MPRVVPAWRKFTVKVPANPETGEPEKDKIIIEKYMLLSINAREAMKNGGGEWFLGAQAQRGRRNRHRDIEAVAGEQRPAPEAQAFPGAECRNRRSRG